MKSEIVWKRGEEAVEKFMKNKGYKIVFRNFKTKFFELDIVAILPKKVQKRSILGEIRPQIAQITEKYKKQLLKYTMKNRIKNLKDLLVITEVKARSSDRFGKGIDAIDSEKVRHLELGAETLLKLKKFKNMQVRFDVASVDEGEISYFENAL